MEENIKMEWMNVGIASALIVVSMLVSFLFNLNLMGKLFTASIRCVVQLTLVAEILKPIFETNAPYYVFPLAALMTISGTIEVSLLKTKLYYDGMFLNCLFSLIVTNFCLGLFGTAVIMQVTPVYRAQHYIPTFGMLLGNSTSAIALSLNTFLGHLKNEKEKIELNLCFGASSWEAVLPLVKNSIRIGMLPTLNSMSVLGLVTIPGMMTGQILGGIAPIDAVKYQIIIMFMIGASTTLCTLVCVLLSYWMLFDHKDHVLLYEKLKERKGFFEMIQASWIKKRVQL